MDRPYFLSDHIPSLVTPDQDYPGYDTYYFEFPNFCAANVTLESADPVLWKCGGIDRDGISLYFAQSLTAEQVSEFLYMMIDHGRKDKTAH